MKICAIAIFALWAAVSVSWGGEGKSTSNPEKAAEISPKQLAFNAVRAGAIVEGSVLMIVPGTTTAGVPVEVHPPEFARVDGVRTRVHEYGKGNTYRICLISISVDTAKTGHYNAPLHISFGMEKFDLPLSVDVSERDPADTRLLVVDSPYDGYSGMSDCEPWRKILERGKYDPNYLLINSRETVFRELDLSTFDVVFLADEGVIGLQDSDVARLKKFAENGGRVIVATNSFMSGSQTKANQILVPYGLHMKSSDIYFDMPIKAPHIATHALTRGVNALSFDRRSTLELNGLKKCEVLVANPALPNTALAAVARAGNGEVIALAEALWWHWLNEGAEKGWDNAALLERMVTKPHTARTGPGQPLTPPEPQDF